MYACIGALRPQMGQMGQMGRCKQVCKPLQIGQITSPTKLQPSGLILLALLTLIAPSYGVLRTSSVEPEPGPNRHRRYDNQVLSFADRYLPLRQVIRTS